MKKGGQWQLIVKSYFISKVPEIAGILQSIEEPENVSASMSHSGSRILGRALTKLGPQHQQRRRQRQQQQQRQPQLPQHQQPSNVQ